MFEVVFGDFNHGLYEDPDDQDKHGPRHTDFLSRTQKYSQTFSCIDPAESAQVMLLKRMPQLAFSCPAPNVGVGGCRN